MATLNLRCRCLRQPPSYAESGSFSGSIYLWGQHQKLINKFLWICAFQKIKIKNCIYKKTWENHSTPPLQFNTAESLRLFSSPFSPSPPFPRLLSQLSKKTSQKKKKHVFYQLYLFFNPFFLSTFFLLS